MKLSDGLFLNTFKEIASKYPGIISDDLIVDAACMNLVINPQKIRCNGYAEFIRGYNI